MKYIELIKIIDDNDINVVWKVPESIYSSDSGNYIYFSRDRKVYRTSHLNFDAIYQNVIGNTSVKMGLQSDRNVKIFNLDIRRVDEREIISLTFEHSRKIK